MKDKFKAILSRAYLVLLIILTIVATWDSISRIEKQAEHKAFLQSVLSHPEIESDNEYDKIFTHERARQELSVIKVVDWTYIIRNLMVPIGLALCWHVGEWVLFGSTTLRPYRLSSHHSSNKP